MYLQTTLIDFFCTCLILLIQLCEFTYRQLSIGHKYKVSPRIIVGSYLQRTHCVCPSIEKKTFKKVALSFFFRIELWGKEINNKKSLIPLRDSDWRWRSIRLTQQPATVDIASHEFIISAGLKQRKTRKSEREINRRKISLPNSHFHSNIVCQGFLFSTHPLLHFRSDN